LNEHRPGGVTVVQRCRRHDLARGGFLASAIRHGVHMTFHSALRIFGALLSVCVLPVAADARPLTPAVQDSPVVRVVSTIDVGGQPHGIRFDERGDTAWVALPGENAIAVIDVAAGRVVRRDAAGNTPLDLVRLESGDWLVSQFGGTTLETFLPQRDTWEVGGGPSLFAPRTVDGRAFIVSEFDDRLSVFDLRARSIVAQHRTGRRPYPPAVVRDGSLVFVPNRNANSVTVIDALNGAIVRTVDACGQPQGGGLTPDDVNYIVACAGPPQLLYINTASFDPVASVTAGLGRRPFSVAFSPDGRWGLVNNAGDSTVSVLDVRKRIIVDHVIVGTQPIAVRMHPDGRRAFVANEVSGTVTVLEFAPVPVRPAQPKNEVIVLGMIHGEHRTSQRYGLDVLRRLIRAIEPDFVLTEIPPNRFELARAEFEQTGRITESRVRVFPEYVDVLFPLTREMAFEIIPTAAWNAYMNSFRSAAMAKLPEDPARRSDWAEYQTANARRDSLLAAEGASDDPRFIHTDRYDAILEIAYEPFDRLFNDDLGPGGWGNINRGHNHYIARALDEHRGEGKRFIITYGAGHKGPILRELRKRDDIVILDAAPFLDRIGVPKN
jgi:DNA-binding beta-propeller fold protein YncE